MVKTRAAKIDEHLDKLDELDALDIEGRIKELLGMLLDYSWSDKERFGYVVFHVNETLVHMGKVEAR